ncbi:MAG TPA: PaaI family thioesterase [Burkholderiales bacterium]|nr:PaaI family thioesterase [Burkholderiales bacterium]
MSTAQPAAVNNADVLLRVPFLLHLGVQVDSMEPGHAVLSLEPRPEHYNSWGGVHGGVIMTLLDVCMAIAGRAYDPANLSGVTVDMSSSFISPGKGKQIAIGRVIARSTTLWRCEGEIRNASDDSLVARSMGTFKFKNLMNQGKLPVGDA